MRTMVEKTEPAIALEFGPGEVLTGLIRRTVSHVATFNMNKAENLDNFE